jgi:hypothetical protein
MISKLQLIGLVNFLIISQLECIHLRNENLISQSMALSNLHSTSIDKDIITNRKPRPNIIKYVSALKPAFESIHEGLIGGMAGIIQVLCFMWLRTTISYQYRYGLTMQDSIRDLYLQGGIPRFYKGLSFALIQGPLSKFGAVASNDFASKFKHKHIHTTLNMIINTGIGAIFASLFRFLLMPIDTCKTVLQVEGKVGFNNLMQDVRVYFSLLYNF